MKKQFAFIAAILLLVASCSQDDDNDNNNNNNTPAALTIDSTYIFRASIDGQAVNYRLGNQFWMVASDGEIATPPTLSRKSYSSIVIDNLSGTNTLVSLEMGVVSFLGTYAEDAEFLNLFQTGNYNFIADPQTTKGFVLRYYDSTGTEWATNLGSANQAGSSIKIEAVKNVTFSGDPASVKVLLRFNCKLYNSAGASKTLTNGEFIGLFENS